MSAVAPTTAPTAAAARILTTAAQQVTVGLPDISLADIFECGFCRRVVCQAAGTVFVQRKEDPAPISYAVTAGYAVDGYIVLIGGSTNHPTASAIALSLEA
jgi:hypothetical protein